MTKPGGRQKAQHPKQREQGGFSLLELSITVGIVAIGLTIALSGYRNFSDRADSGDASSDLQIVSTEVERFFTLNGEYPDTLAEVGFVKLDPWGNQYQYFNIANAVGKGKLRKDKNLVPINSDFDLYSMGPDGASAAPLTAAASRDDIIRASNGAFIGLASDY